MGGLGSQGTMTVQERLFGGSKHLKYQLFWVLKNVNEFLNFVWFWAYSKVVKPRF
jgi:hypothetical protein